MIYMEWDLQLQKDQEMTHDVVEEIVHTVIESGYNFYGGKYPARFSITGLNSDEDTHHTGDDCEGGIDSIVQLFRDYDPKQTSITIWFSREKGPHIPFGLAIMARTSIDATLVSFHAQDKDINSESKFNLLLDLCQKIFVSHDFSFGGFSDEYNPSIPYTVEELLSQGTSRVLFLSSPISDRINQDSLESLQPEEIRELEGGKLLIAISRTDYPRQYQKEIITEDLVE